MQIDQPLDNTIQHLQKYVFREYVLGEIVDKRTVGVILGDDPILELILMKMSLGAYKILCVTNRSCSFFHIFALCLFIILMATER